MDFTEVYRAKAAVFSPDGWCVLATSDNRVVIRQTDTFQITHNWPIDPTSSVAGAASASSTSGSSSRASPPSDHLQFEWSCDSRYVLAANCKGTPPQVQVFDVLDPNWSASIRIGIEGVTRAIWAPDGRTILCFSEWAVSRFYTLSARTRLTECSSSK